MTECIGALCKIEKSLRRYEAQAIPTIEKRTSELLSFDAIYEHQARLELYDVCAGTLDKG